jgi:hypothetical protein
MMDLGSYIIAQVAGGLAALGLYTLATRKAYNGLQ